jgi:hypothetical protein
MLVQIDERQLPPLEPPFEVVQDPQPMPHCRSAVTELDDSRDERLKMNAKQACPSALYSCRILKEILKHLSPPFRLENDGGEDSRIMPRLPQHCKKSEHLGVGGDRAEQV